VIVTNPSVAELPIQIQPDNRIEMKGCSVKLVVHLTPYS
jgi:hypothetical protein